MLDWGSISDNKLLDYGLAISRENFPSVSRVVFQAKLNKGLCCSASPKHLFPSFNSSYFISSSLHETEVSQEEVLSAEQDQVDPLRISVGPCGSQEEASLQEQDEDNDDDEGDDEADDDVVNDDGNDV